MALRGVLRPGYIHIRSTSARHAAASPAARRSISSIRPATATRCSRAGSPITLTTRSGCGRWARLAGRSSSISGIKRAFRERRLTSMIADILPQPSQLPPFFPARRLAAEALVCRLELLLEEQERVA